MDKASSGVELDHWMSAPKSWTLVVENEVSALVTVSNTAQPQSRVVEAVRGRQGFLLPGRPQGSGSALTHEGTQWTCAGFYRTQRGDLPARDGAFLRAGRPS